MLQNLSLGLKMDQIVGLYRTSGPKTLWWSMQLCRVRVMLSAQTKLIIEDGIFPEESVRLVTSRLRT